MENGVCAVGVVVSTVSEAVNGKLLPCSSLGYVNVLPSFL